MQTVKQEVFYLETLSAEDCVTIVGKLVSLYNYRCKRSLEAMAWLVDMRDDETLDRFTDNVLTIGGILELPISVCGHEYHFSTLAEELKIDEDFAESKEEVEEEEEIYKEQVLSPKPSEEEGEGSEDSEVLEMQPISSSRLRSRELLKKGVHIISELKPNSKEIFLFNPPPVDWVVHPPKPSVSSSSCSSSAHGTSCACPGVSDSNVEREQAYILESILAREQAPGGPVDDYPELA